MLGLPRGVTACLFDVDGVLTDTASVHAAAWAEAFDPVLLIHAERAAQQFVPFDPRSDYATYVDGKRREDGVRAFLASRGLALPEGAPADPPEADTVHGVGNRKNAQIREHLRTSGVKVYEGSVRYLHAARDAGLRMAVVSSSTNTEQVLSASGLAEFFQVRVDGLTARQRSLPGKPAPDMFLLAASMLQVQPTQTAVFEDALAGVAAGRAGGFGYVVGIDRLGQADMLRERGADIVVEDLAELLDGVNAASR